MKLKKNNIYICRIKSQSREILNDLGILKDGVFTREIDESMIQDDEMKRSYLRGPFSRRLCK